MSRMRILITAGPTREPIDPVRFISNYSTGAMGYAIAAAAQKRGHGVVLISGPTLLMPPEKIKRIRVTTAIEMFQTVRDNYKKADCIIMAAAVSDFRPAPRYRKKLKQQAPIRYIALRKNPDILCWLGNRKAGRILVGFCMETGGLIPNAKKKIKRKNLDIIVANRIDNTLSAFGTGKTSVLILGPKIGKEALSGVRKQRIAGILLDKIEGLWYKKGHPTNGHRDML